MSRPAVSALQRAAFGSWADCSLPAALTALLARPQDVGSGHRLEPACLGVPSFPDMVSLLLSNQVLIKKKIKALRVFHYGLSPAAVLPGPGPGEPRWNEHRPQQDQPDPHGEVPEAAGHVSHPGEGGCRPGRDEEGALELEGGVVGSPGGDVLRGLWGGGVVLHPRCCRGRVPPTHLPFCFSPADVAAAGVGEERRARRRRRLHDLHEADCR